MTLPKRSRFSLISPAKINLFFLILGKRSDSFHEIASLYQAVNIFDTINFELADVDQFSSNIKDLAVPSNSIITALNLFRQEFNIHSKVKIHLEKKIPIEAGLGGGSSNAATTLFALNKFFRDGKDQTMLIKLAKKIGSDVPFFFSNGAAICTGKGDIVENVVIPPIKGWILRPKFGISTPKVYASINKITLNQNYQTLLEKFQINEFNFVNDLQPFAEIVEPRILKVQRQYPQATMTGSGSCFFTLKKPEKSSLIEKIFSFKRVSRDHLGWYSINQ